MPDEKARGLFAVMREVFRRLNYSDSTEEAYTKWIRRFIAYHGRRAPRDMGAAEVTQFLNHLAVEREVEASTQQQALCALVFLYREVYKREMPELEGLIRSHRSQRVPTVLTREEVRKVIDQLEDPVRLIVQILYGSGVRLMEALTLRVKDVDLERGQITVRRGKGGKDRATLLPEAIRRDLKAQLELVARRHKAELAAGRGLVDLPRALREKMPGAARRLEWQYVFPAGRTTVQAGTGQVILHHLDESVVQKAITRAARQAGIDKRVTSHTFRHSFATHLLEDHVDIRTIQALLGHDDVSTTMVYTHLVKRGPLGVRSPLDR